MKYLDKTGLTYFWNKIKSSLNNKQDKLTAGENITITNNVISATGGDDIDEVPINTIVEYEGDTVPDGWELVEESEEETLNYISVNKNTNSIYTLAQGFGKVPVTNVMSRNGTKLSVSSVGITIGAGVSKIKADGAIALYNASGTFGVAIIKNDETDAGRLTMAWGQATAEKDSYILTTTAYADVQEGDVISLYLYTGTAQSANVQNNCQLNIEVIC